MKLFVLRLIKHLSIYFFISLPLIVVGIVALPVVAFFYDIGKMPIWSRWFDSADPYVGRDTTTIEIINKQGWFKKYWWVAIRNPINYFSYKYLSFVLDEDALFILEGEPNVGDSTGDIPGYKYIEVIQKDKTYYEYYYIKKWSKTKCFRFRMGYKIGDPYLNQKGEIQQEVLVLQPYKSYSGL